MQWALAFGDSDTIAASEWAVSPSGLAIGTDEYAPSISGTFTKVWLSGGTSGVTYTATNTITSTLGRIFRRSFVVVVDDSL